jgi:TPR repeat protein
LRRALPWYEQAARAGSTLAMLRLSHAYTHYLENDEQANYWLREAAGRGNGNAAHQLGLRYLEGKKGLPRDPAQGEKYLLQGAHAGSAEAMRDLGIAYYEGEDLTRNYAAAQEWLFKAVHAFLDKKLIDEQSLKPLKEMYKKGLGVTRDEKLADTIGDILTFYTGTSTADDANAFFNLGYFARHVDQRALAVKSFAQAADRLATQKREDDRQRAAWAFWFVGQAHFQGFGVAQDYTQAMPYFLKSAELGYAEAMRTLATMYNGDYGYPQDVGKLVHWMRKAAEAGNAAAMENMAALYAEGVGVPQDLAEAAKWREKAAAAEEAGQRN